MTHCGMTYRHWQHTSEPLQRCLDLDVDCQDQACATVRWAPLRPAQVPSLPSRHDGAGQLQPYVRSFVVVGW